MRRMESRPNLRLVRQSGDRIDQRRSRQLEETPSDEVPTVSIRRNDVSEPRNINARVAEYVQNQLRPNPEEGPAPAGDRLKRAIELMMKLEEAYRLIIAEKRTHVAVEIADNKPKLKPQFERTVNLAETEPVPERDWKQLLRAAQSDVASLPLIPAGISLEVDQNKLAQTRFSDQLAFLQSLRLRLQDEQHKSMPTKTRPFIDATITRPAANG